jgi:diaminohydroxyphosphoribosylaminopyrimidine deaminase/5-amino-6-(5-phosphoribosylamino)uracil reductase
MLFISPKIIGGKDAVSSVMGMGVKNVGQAIKLKDIQVRRFDDEFLIQAGVS